MVSSEKRTLPLRWTGEPSKTRRSGSLLVITALMIVLVGLATTSPARSQAAHPFAPGDPAPGEIAFRTSCGGCHALERNRIGPKLAGVVGRKSGSVAEFNYSPALKAEDIKWTAKNLDRWLTNPRAMVPGTRMAIRISDAKRRADLIAYLEQQSK